VILFILLKAGALFAFPPCNVPSPELNCLSVSSNGNVTLTWSAPPSDPSFNSYQIFKSSSFAGPYTVVDSVFSAVQTTYTDVGVNANVAPVFYYVKTRCSGLIYSQPIDTLETMNLKVINPLNGTAQLSWNPLATPTSLSTSNTYSIYQEYPAGLWTLVGSKKNIHAITYSFLDTIIPCNLRNSTINYRVEITDNTGCTSVSSDTGAVFHNNIPPPSPIFDTLSVDDNNITLLSWNKNPASDTKGYVIYRFNGVSFVIVDTVLGINNTSFTYTLSTSSTNSERYRLLAFDSCGNPSLYSLPVYNTIYLNASADICNRSAKLSWAGYPHQIGTGLSNYLIYQSTVGTSGPYILAGSVSEGVHSYTAAGLAPKTNYYFKVTAIDSSGTKTASSNRIMFYSATPKAPLFLYLRSASVVGSNQIDVTFHVDVTASISNYKVYRALDNDTTAPVYKQIAAVPPSNSTPITFSDMNVNPNKYSYNYQIVVVDSCGFDGEETNVGHTILLKVSGNSGVQQNYLTWNNYGNWQNGVNSYNIYRGMDGVINPTPIANVPVDSSGINNYTDDVSSVLSGDGIFNYYIEAVEASGNSFGFTDKSSSNIAEAYQDPIIYIPNAFFPEGINKIFKPVITYVDNTEYEFSIFDRWGELIFTTNDTNEGWSGTSKGNKYGFGVYVYVIKLKTARGDYKTLKGTITLLD
jgi:gliding motility-associated-like protein